MIESKKMLTALIISLSMLFIGCGMYTSIDSAIETLEENGYMITGRTAKYYEMIGASDGASLKIDGKMVEMYISPDDTSIFEGLAAGASAITVGNLYVLVHEGGKQFATELEKALN